MNGFSALMAIALVNGLIHGQVFFLLYDAVGLTQATSNLAAFCVASAFSFYVSALYIFGPQESWSGYLLLNCITGALSYGIGSIGDALNLPGWETLALYFLLNLTTGYSFFRFKLLRGRQRV
ncbi:polysaccharide synthesis protein GtrA [Pseudomonas sp. OA65]|uniref:polysaccharide synthesis protein GtrA n=1 Tax=Pseudomonas sp. OA65 TaxID=2818431 RepID=UPI001A9E3CEB|nr:polysaccharide synthesis protein GtrA [Pseudomonas sp. OA65]MBO1541369.1 polysaccharide synthesis protein GtrA [Pseudomonas sp. OA65]